MPSISQRFSASLRARDHQILSAAGSASRLHPFVFDWIECPGSEPADARRCCRQHFVRRRRDLHCTAQHVGAERHDRFAGPHAEGTRGGEKNPGGRSAAGFLDSESAAPILLVERRDPLGQCWDPRQNSRLVLTRRAVLQRSKSIADHPLWLGVSPVSAHRESLL